MREVNKELVRQRFARNLHTYAEQAMVQRECAERLIFELCAAVGTDYDRIFEFGCGSGVLTAMIAENLRYNHIYLNDLVEECHELVTEITDCEFIPGDIEKLEALPHDLDLIISNAAFQWIQHPEKAIELFAGMLKQYGTLALVTFGPRNTEEISTLTGVKLPYPEVDELKQMLKQHFHICCCHENIRQLPFETPEAVLRHLKETGVTGLRQKGWTPAKLREFSEEYRKRFSTKQGAVGLTYHPVIIVARKLPEASGGNVV